MDISDILTFRFETFESLERAFHPYFNHVRYEVGAGLPERLVREVHPKAFAAAFQAYVAGRDILGAYRTTLEEEIWSARYELDSLFVAPW